FFFSSRRRHTISKRDWSSDVCSSDLFQFQSYSRLAQFFFHLSCLPDRLRGEISRRLSDTAKLGLRHHVSDETALIGLTLNCHVRSEERRVGKECRSRCVREE